MTEGRPIYIRRLAADDRGRLVGRLRRRSRFQVWRGQGEPETMTFSQLDHLLDGRARPADYWAVVDAANAAFRSGDHRRWIRADDGPTAPPPPPDL